MASLKIFLVTLAVVVMAYALPVHAQSIQDAATEVEAAIQSAMSSSGTGNGPTLGQLGGVQAGATGSDAGAGAGGDGSSGGGGSGGGSGGSGGGSSCCFLPGTLVAMADGSSQPIEAVKVGDMVLSFDPETGKTSREKVLALESPVRDHHYVMTFADGSVLKLTDEHPLWATVDGVKGWASINPANSLKHDGLKTLPLKVGDTVYAMGGKWTAIAKLERVDGDVRTYNLSGVSNAHTFFADEKGVHNKSACCFLAGTLVLMADGSAMPIEDVKIGDSILSFDVNTDTVSKEKVLELEAPIRDHHYVMTFEDGSKLKVTDDHPMWGMVDGQKGWASINPANSLKQYGMKSLPLKVGGKLYTKGNGWTTITKLVRVDGNVQTYNLKSISNTKTFFVAPADEVERERRKWRLAHNKGL